MNVLEKHRILNDATRRYLHGEIDYHELTRIRRTCEIDYMAGLTALVRFQRSARQAERAEVERLRQAAERRRFRWWPF